MENTAQERESHNVYILLPGRVRKGIKHAAFKGLYTIKEEAICIFTALKDKEDIK